MVTNAYFLSSVRNRSRCRRDNLAALLAFLLAGFLVACASESKEWDSVQQSGAIDRYEAFLKTYPNGEHAREAREQLSVLVEARDWRQAETDDTDDALRSFLEKHPSSSRTAAARARMSSLTAVDATIVLFYTMVTRGQLSGGQMPLPPALEKRVAAFIASGSIQCEGGAGFNTSFRDGNMISSLSRRSPTSSSFTCVFSAHDSRVDIIEGEIGLVRGNIHVRDGTRVSIDGREHVYKARKWAATGQQGMSKD